MKVAKRYSPSVIRNIVFARPYAQYRFRQAAHKAHLKDHVEKRPRQASWQWDCKVTTTGEQRYVSFHHCL